MKKKLVLSISVLVVILIAGLIIFLPTDDREPASATITYFETYEAEGVAAEITEGETLEKLFSLAVAAGKRAKDTSVAMNDPVYVFEVRDAAGEVILSCHINAEGFFSSKTETGLGNHTLPEDSTLYAELDAAFKANAPTDDREPASATITYFETYEAEGVTAEVAEGETLKELFDLAVGAGKQAKSTSRPMECPIYVFEARDAAGEVILSCEIDTNGIFCSKTEKGFGNHTLPEDSALYAELDAAFKAAAPKE